MSWTSFSGSTRFLDLPIILAGPILRKVSKDAVTVWVATKMPVGLKLSISEADTHVAKWSVTQTSSELFKVGRNLYVTCMTARPLSSGNDLVPGTIYAYELGVVGQVFSHKEIWGAADFSLGYGLYALPTFALPPDDLNRLRLIHGSCRMPHAEGRDALSTLDGLIAARASDPDLRPHYLALTGDQIYADDVADVLLFMLMDAGKTLLGLGEDFSPLVPSQTSFYPGARQNLITIAKMTSTDAASHLIYFEEFACMYLFVWSDVLWPNDADFPTFDNVYESRESPTVARLTDPYDDGPVGVEILPSNLANTFDAHRSRLQSFRAGLHAVRRALANVPTYMIFDDHEVTDDWFLDRQWVSNTTSSSPSGALPREIIRNGMAAYSLFQAWGNTPDAFEDSASPAFRMKTTLTSWIQGMIQHGTANGEAVTLAEQMGIPRFDGTRLGDAMAWDFLVSGPKHQILFLDSRTRRYYPPNEEHGRPGLLDSDAFASAFAKVTVFGKEDVLIVVAPAPVLGMPVLALLQKPQMTRYVFDREGWEGDETAFQRFLSSCRPCQKHVRQFSGDQRGEGHGAATAQAPVWNPKQQQES